MTVGCVSRVIALSPYIPLSRSQARHRRRVATNARLPRQAVVEEAGREERRYCGRRALVSLCTIAFGGALLDRTAAAETSEAITISVDDVIPTTAASAVEAAASVVASTPPPPPRRPSACATGTSCVSTSSFRSPANFLPPWDYGPTESDSDAFAKLTSVLREKPGSIITTADEKTGMGDGFLPKNLFLPKTLSLPTLVVDLKPIDNLPPAERAPSRRLSGRKSGVQRRHGRRGVLFSLGWVQDGVVQVTESSEQGIAPGMLHPWLHQWSAQPGAAGEPAAGIGVAATRDGRGEEVGAAAIALTSESSRAYKAPHY